MSIGSVDTTKIFHRRHVPRRHAALMVDFPRTLLSIERSGA